MSKEIKNKAASIQARLENIAKVENIAFDMILLMYIQERFLYRLAKSPYAEDFLLKGGLLLFAMSRFKGRSTKDIDFLADKTTFDIHTIRRIINEVCEIECDDGIKFDSKNFEIIKIKEETNYEGIRIKINSYLGKAKKFFQIDIGFGDTVYPAKLRIEYPLLLEKEKLFLYVYPEESIISEKFEAMLSLSTINSRMKDFYDICWLLNQKSYDGTLLKEAINKTLRRRKTHLEKLPEIFTEAFYIDKIRIKLWDAFIQRIGKEEISFKIVMEDIKTFLFPVYNSIIERTKFELHWDKEKKLWK